MKKPILIILGVLLLVVLVCGGLIGGGIYWIYQATQPPVDAANQLLALVAQGKTSEAYASTATALRNQQTEAEFAAVVKGVGLADYASATFPTRNVVNNEATIVGVITTKSGGSIPVEVKLVFESDQWRVLALNAPNAKVAATTKQQKEVPSDAEARRLTTATMVDFDQAVQAGDFKPFYGKIAKLWQSQTTPAALQKIFQSFIDQKIDLAEVKDIEPVFDAPPAVDQGGMLALSGYYPAKGRRISFKLRYAYEHPSWKLVAVEVNVKPQ